MSEPTTNQQIANSLGGKEQAMATEAEGGSLLRSVQQTLALSLDAEEMGQRFVQLTREAWGFDRADFLWLESQNQVLRPLFDQAPAFPLVFFPGSLAKQAVERNAAWSLDPSANEESPEAKWLASQGFPWIVAWPLFHGGAFCCLVLFAFRDLPLEGPQPEDLADLAHPLAAALVNARLYTLANKQLEMIALLDRAGMAIALGEEDLRTVLRKTLEEVRAFIGSHNIRLYRLDEQSQILYPEVAVCAPGRYSPQEEKMIGTMTLHLGEGITGWVAATGQPLLSGDAEREPRGRHMPGTAFLDESMISVPLKVGESILGALTMAKLGLFQFGELEMRLASLLASQMAIALENARLYQIQLKVRTQLEQDIERIRKLEAVREDFLYSVSHELKTPLAAIAATLEMLDQVPPEQRAQFLLGYRDLLMRSSERLQRLVGNLLETSKFTSGSLELYLVAHDPLALAREALQRMEPEAASKKLTLELEAGEGLQQLYLDRERTLQVLGNLLSNAIKYSMPGGKVTLSLLEEKAGVTFAIRDRGFGISREEQLHIFERFFRSSSTQSFNASGSGLGLFLSKALVEAHGGRMGIESELGRGTRVWFTLPRNSQGHR
ncbi:MAG: ATP-binding protein [Coprothermobacterota bacterium]|nr:ATP-binding protein [Coprothermobacterota bacterium]